ncbi:DUF4397 domain-containing protein [Pontibacter korlensis]|uniref:DUF4397 domain-containing protein n=1 Tax=Pontibacter korlensis TaxID=400092 RepID=UPI001F367EF1|nr:DUF4397 domain-containing protein [Pontibacter korlensis]
MKNWMKLMLLTVLPTVFLASCDDDDDDLDLTDQANVMIVHASPDAPGIDLYVDDAKVNNAALNYLDNIGYLNVEAGNRNFKVTAAGTGTGSPVINADVNLIEDMSYTIFAADI